MRARNSRNTSNTRTKTCPIQYTRTADRLCGLQMSPGPSNEAIYRKTWKEAMHEISNHLAKGEPRRPSTTRILTPKLRLKRGRRLLHRRQQGTETVLVNRALFRKERLRTSLLAHDRVSLCLLRRQRRVPLRRLNTRRPPKPEEGYKASPLLSSRAQGLVLTTPPAHGQRHRGCFWRLRLRVTKAHLDRPLEAR